MLEPEAAAPGEMECVMPFKPNYNQQRAERNRLKQAKKEAKVRERADAAARRKTEQDESAEPQDALPPGGDVPPQEP